MYEVEVKVRADHDRVIDRLDEIGATHVERVVQEDTYYDAPHRDFAETDEALRIRRERQGASTAVRLTYKGPLLEAESKTREEHETGVDDGEAAAGILDGLGFSPVETVRKERERYAVEDYTITLDRVDGLGEFVEIETEVGAESAIEAARTDAYDLLRDLGLDPDAQIRTSYLGLLLDSRD